LTEEARPDVKSTRFKVVDGLLIAMMILPILTLTMKAPPNPMK
jgi:hypothetical protein